MRHGRGAPAIPPLFPAPACLTHPPPPQLPAGSAGPRLLPPPPDSPSYRARQQPHPAGPWLLASYCLTSRERANAPQELGGPRPPRAQRFRAR